MSAKKKPFRATIKAERARLGITQEQAAEILSIPVRTYRDWEYGYATPAVIAQEGAIARFSKTPTSK